MRRVTYFVNDREYMKREWAGKVDNLDAVLSGLPATFACVYTLIGEE